MKRRAFIAGLAGAAAWPSRIRAAALPKPPARRSRDHQTCRRLPKSHVEERQLNDLCPAVQTVRFMRSPRPQRSLRPAERERTMFRHLAVSSMAVVGLLTMAVAPADAGAKTGTWKYWNPSLAQAAPPYWQSMEVGTRGAATVSRIPRASRRLRRILATASWARLRLQPSRTRLVTVRRAVCPAFSVPIRSEISILIGFSIDQPQGRRARPR